MSFWDDWIEDGKGRIEDGVGYLFGIKPPESGGKPVEPPTAVQPPAPPSPLPSSRVVSSQSINWQAAGVIVGGVGVLLTLVTLLKRKR